MGCNNSKADATADPANSAPPNPPTPPAAGTAVVTITQNESLDHASPSAPASAPVPAPAPAPPKLSAPANTGAVEKACFGAGCYWGTEKYLRYSFQEKFAHLDGRIISGQVGFMGPVGSPANPTYKDVCSGSTGHVEVFHLEYTGGPAYYEAMVRYYFQFHDPTTADRQGNDKGTQYASVLYCYTDEQRAIAQKVKDELQTHLDFGKIKGYTGKTVTTDIRDSTVFYPAHEEHQDYLTHKPDGYCNHRIRFKEWPEAVFSN